MLVAAHALEILILIGAPFVIARVLTKRWGLPFGIVGVGLLTFIAGQVVQMLFAKLTSAAFESGAIPIPAGEFVMGSPDNEPQAASYCQDDSNQSTHCLHRKSYSPKKERHVIK